MLPDSVRLRRRSIAPRLAPGDVIGAGGGNILLVQGDGFGLFAAGCGVLQLGDYW